MAELLFFVIAFIAEVIGTIAGFGSSTILLPLSLFFLDFKTALILVAFFHFFGNLGRMTFFVKGLDKKLILLFAVPSVLLTIIGALLINYSNQDVLKMILGIFLLLFSVISLINPKLKFSPTKRNIIISGGVSGFFAGIIGVGGALRGAFLQSFKLDKVKYIATAAIIAVAVDITRIPIYLGSGFLQPEFYSFIPLLFIIAIAGVYVGKKIVNVIPQEIFRKIVLIAIALVSIKFIYDGLVLL